MNVIIIIIIIIITIIIIMTRDHWIQRITFAA